MKNNKQRPVSYCAGTSPASDICCIKRDRCASHAEFIGRKGDFIGVRVHTLMHKSMGSACSSFVEIEEEESLSNEY